MAKLVFQSPEARDHFKEVVAASIESDSYFGDQGLHAKIEYLRTYVDKGNEHEIITNPGGGMVCARKAECIIGWARGDELALTMRYADRERTKGSYGEWVVIWYGGLVKHSDGTWGVHT